MLETPPGRHGPPVEGGAADAERAAADRLLAAGKLDRAGLDRAVRAQAASGDRLAAILTKLGLVTENDMARALADTLGLPLAGEADYPTEAVGEDRVSVRFLKDSRILPVRLDDGGVALAMVDPLDTFAEQAIAAAFERPVQRMVAIPADLDKAHEALYRGVDPSVAEDSGSGAHGDPAAAAEEDAERLKDLASEAPVIRLVNAFIARAVEVRASDIHIEPFESMLRVRYRIDGVLHEIETPPAHLRGAIVSRVKIMAKLNIAERRLPQDGRVRLVVRGQEIDFRVSTLPTMHGESVVMRILDKTSQVLDFTALGFEEDALAKYLEILERPNGILLVTGPTGSGKTTTLYTSLLRLNTPDKKLISVEDPVEYELQGVNQIQVKSQIGLTFAHALRSILRQDPDIIMVGEIRDRETAQIAAQSALTGHLVLSTLHTNSAAASVTRLLDMGLEAYLLGSTVNGITAQRLVRRLCPHCREPDPNAATLAEQFSFPPPPAGGWTVHRPVGCDHCGHTGYRGRTGITEILVMNDAIRQLVLRHADSSQIQRTAEEAGMRTLYQDGIRKVLAGTTSLEEVLRVTREV